MTSDGVSPYQSQAGQTEVAPKDCCAQGLDPEFIQQLHKQFGVRTPAQRALLEEYGCRYAQGELFGGPMPAELVETMFPGPGAGVAWTDEARKRGESEDGKRRLIGPRGHRGRSERL